MADDELDPLASVEPTRRSFIKKMAGVAFAAPMIGSFSLAELASASPTGDPGQYHPNQEHHHHHHRR